MRISLTVVGLLAGLLDLPRSVPDDATGGCGYGCATQWSRAASCKWY